MTVRFVLLCALVWQTVQGQTSDRKAFVLLGATGDNAYRPSGFWTGLFEAWCTDIFTEEKVDIHVQINKGHTVEEINGKVMETLMPFYATLQADVSWKCRLATGDCSPQTFFGKAQMNIWMGEGKYNASGQAMNMSFLSAYQEVIAYMNLPPYAYSEWSGPMVQNWGGGSKLQIAVEKPFGGGRDSLGDATQLHESIVASGLPEDSLHLTDHWLSFFMNKHLPDFRKIVQPRLGIDFSTKDIQKIVVTEYEERGFGGRGAFIDGLGQVRDMVQSHLLQVLALTMLDPDHTDSIDSAKLNIFDSLSLASCELWQFDGLLESKDLTYHPSFADSTFSRVHLSSSLPEWSDVELIIQTGKSMDINLYTVEVYQRGGSGVLTYDVGKEEVGIADIKVENWPLVDSTSFEAPLPSFNVASTMAATPDVSVSGTGYILRYNDPSLYFPKPYSRIAIALLTGDYQHAFVTWPECLQCWTILTDSSPSVCLDPAPEVVEVYIPAFLCDKTAPAMCDQHETVQHKYDVTYACTAQNSIWYNDTDLYQAKCSTAFVVV